MSCNGHFFKPFHVPIRTTFPSGILECIEANRSEHCGGTYDRRKHYPSQHLPDRDLENAHAIESDILAAQRIEDVIFAVLIERLTGGLFHEFAGPVDIYAVIPVFTRLGYQRLLVGFPV